MSKSYVMFSIALGGLALVGCNKDEPATPSPTPTTAPSTTMPSMPSLPTMPAMPAMPTTGEMKDKVGAVMGEMKDKAGDMTKGMPTTVPSLEGTK